MKTVLEIKYRLQARNAEHYQLYGALLAIILESLSTKYKLTAYRSKLAASLARENEAYLQNKAYEGSKVIEEMNQTCDRRYRSLELAVQSKALSDTAAEVTAANQISFAMKPYKGAPNKPHAENIAMVRDLVGTLESDKYAASVETLGLTAQVAALKTSVADFEAALSGRASERLTRVSSDNMKAIRPVVEQDFADLAQLLSSLYLVAAYVDKDATKAAELDAVVNALNAEIVRFHDTLARRGIGSVTKPGTDTDAGDGGADSESPDEI